MEHLIQKSTEVSSQYAISKIHFECKGPQRQRVILAAQLLSRTVSKGLLRYAPEMEPESKRQARLKLSEFIETVNDWFDVMNSFIKDDSIPTKSGYGYKFNI